MLSKTLLTSATVMMGSRCDPSSLYFSAARFEYAVVRFLKIAIASRADSMLKEEKRKARGTNEHRIATKR
tara:strand:- start:45 stop:254 length:210 start_codon:yes stop_codon:yes gene_type:complete